VVERIGVERSRTALATAAAIVLVVDGSLALEAGDRDLATLLAERASDARTPVVIALNKQDLGMGSARDELEQLLPEATVSPVSATTGVGLGELEGAIVQTLQGGASGEARPALISARQRAAVDRALRHIQDAQEARASGFPQDLLATPVRAALHAVGEVTGEDVDEAVIQEIFSRFCIGK
jgi:tRNA modification GTPase